MLKSEWWIVTTIAGAVISFVMAYILATTRERRLDNKRTDESHTNRIGSLETKVAILQTTAVTEDKVRVIVHEQVQPLVVGFKSLQLEMQELQKVLIRLDAKIPDQINPS